MTCDPASFCSRPFSVFWIYIIRTSKMFRIDLKSFDTRGLKYFVGCAWESMFTIRSCMACREPPRSLQPHFCSWLCSRSIMLPFRPSLQAWWRVFFLLDFGNWHNKMHPNTFFHPHTLSNHLSTNWLWCCKRSCLLYFSQVNFSYALLIEFALLMSLVKTSVEDDTKLSFRLGVAEYPALRTVE